MEKIISNPGFMHIREQIFGYLNFKTLVLCQEVSEEWAMALQKITDSAEKKYLIENLHNFVGGPKYGILAVLPGMKCSYDSHLFGEREKRMRLAFPEWNKAVDEWAKKAKLEDLRAFQSSISPIIPVHEAARLGRKWLVQFFLLAGYNFNDRTYPYEDTPFHYACQNGHAEVVQLMIESSKKYGIDLNARDEQGGTGFHDACGNDNKEVVELMIRSSKEYGIDLNVRKNSAKTAFHEACTYGTPEIAELMVRSAKEYDIELNVPDGKGKTPFAYAVEFNRHEIVKPIIDILKEDYGLDTERKDLNGKTALDYVFDTGCLPM